MFRVVLFLLAVLCVILPSTQAYAISDPDSMILDDIQAYQSTVESGDILFVMSYQINYTVNPDEAASQAFLLRLMDGTTELRSTAPFSYVNSGYSSGVFSIYFTAAEVELMGITWEDSGYTFRLQGNPNVFASPPVVENGSIDWNSPLFSKSILSSQVQVLALGLEVAWIPYTDPDIDLLFATPTGNGFTAEGEFYFTNVIPNLRVMTPNLFTGSVSNPYIPEREFTLSYRDQLLQFWDNSSIGAAMDGVASVFNTPRTLLTTLGMVAFNIFIIVVMTRANPAAYQIAPLTTAIIFPVGAYIGLTDMIFAGLLAVFAIFGMVFILFLRRG
jgi:hypothetical protein